MGVDNDHRPKCACRWQGEPHGTFAAACVAHSTHAVMESLSLLSVEELQALDMAIVREHVNRASAGSIA